MSSTKPNVLIVALFFVLLGCVGGRYAYTRYQRNQRQAEATSFVANTFAKMGVLDQAEYVRLNQVGESIQNTHVISDADFNWWIALVGRPSTGKSHEREAPLRRLVAIHDGWKYLQPTRVQKDRLFELEKQCLTRPVERNGDDQIFGLVLVSYMNEKRALPYLTPFLQRSPTSQLRHTTEKLMKRWASEDALAQQGGH